MLIDYLTYLLLVLKLNFFTFYSPFACLLYESSVHVLFFNFKIKTIDFLY
jgi:hypothetical protein